jgi:hypothetical protein
MSEILDVLRNIYSASSGSVHPSAASAAIWGLMWNNAWDSGLAAGQAAWESGASDDEVKAAFHRAFADSLGWSDAQNREFWNNDAYHVTADDAYRFDTAWDAFDAFVETMRGRGGTPSAPAM